MRVKTRHIVVRELMADQIPSRHYVTHGLDNYPAKMVAHLARFAIEEVSRKGELILDPFCGCGTVQVECLVTRRAAIGVDINPVAVILAKAKSATYDVAQFAKLAETVVRRAEARATFNYTCPPWLEYWFSAATLRKLLALREAIVATRGNVSPELRNLLLAALVISVRRCSKADPRSPKPFISKSARGLRLGRHFDSISIFLEVVEQMSAAAEDLSSKVTDAAPSIRTYLGDARNTPKRVLPGTIDAVVTSPPYLSAQDYYRSSKLELAVAGFWRPGLEHRLGARIIGSGRGGIKAESPTANAANRPRPVEWLRRVDERAAKMVMLYLTDMRCVLANLHVLLRKGARCCMVVGDSMMGGVHLPVHAWMIDIAEQEGFRLYRHDVDSIRDRRIPPQRQRHGSVIDREHLLFFSRRSSADGRAN